MIVDFWPCARARVARCVMRAALAATAVAVATIPLVAVTQAATKTAKVATVAAPATSGPLLVVVSIGAQRLTAYDRDGRVLESNISSGQKGFETPKGVFAIIERNREHFSNLYDNAPMPNMQRITWSGVAMHAGALPGYPASHGCIRLPFATSAQLFELAKLGTRVVVTADEPVPFAIEHPQLFTRRDPDALLRVAANTVDQPRADGAAPRLTAAVTSDADGQLPLSVLPPTFDLFVGRPSGMSRPEWAAELSARVGPLDAPAKVARKMIAAAEKEAQRLMVQMLSAERTRSALAAKVDALEAAILRGGAVRSIARTMQAKAAADVRLLASVVEVDRLREAHSDEQMRADAITREAMEVVQARDDAAALARAAHRSLKPVSVFVSSKTKRLYVRQGFQPLFDVSIEIADAEAPLGTHVFTAVDQQAQSDAMQWSAITVDAHDPAAAGGGRRKRNSAPVAATPEQLQAARNALDRLRIPEDVRERIGTMIMPGSSLIVSDQGVSNETGKGTDFVILTN
jgi:hypothetical protein